MKWRQISQMGAVLAILVAWTLMAGIQQAPTNWGKTCIDKDEDGYGNPASSACSHPEADCDDTNADVSPGSEEICANLIDDNCDRTVDEGCDLGSIEGTIGGGQFTTSSETPIGIVFSYGYHRQDYTNHTYIFDGVTIPTSGVSLDLYEADDPQFNDVVNAIYNGPPPECSFYTAIGFRPSPPFMERGSYFDSSTIPVPEGSSIEFLSLTIDPFTITSTPAPGGETLWETSAVHFTIIAVGSGG